MNRLYSLFFLLLIVSKGLLAFDQTYFHQDNSSFVQLAEGWRNAFYTDDSKYYFQLNKEGFKQRVRVQRDFCAGIESMQIRFKEPAQKQVDVDVITSFQGTDWLDVYGLDYTNYCWFELSASGIDLNRPTQNSYVIEITFNGKVYFFEGYRNSILPAKRIVEHLQGIEWIELGANGATPVVGGGVFYKIWEPEVDQVELVINESAPLLMHQDLAMGKAGRSHVLFMPQSGVGDEYYFMYKTAGQYLKQVFSNDSEPTALRVDPMAREVVYDKKGGSLNGYQRPRAVVQGNSSFQWRFDQAFSEISELERMSRIIYQIWPLTFDPKKINGKYVSGTFADITQRADYISGLGVNAVELLPIHESKFYAGWGYSLDSILLLQKQYGTSDDLRKLSDTLHERKIQLILDIVLNHVNNSLIRDPIGRYDDQSKYFDGSTDWGPRPRFSSIHVQRWIADSLVSLIQDYHVDGFRFDMTKYIYGGNPAGYRFLQDLTSMLRVVHPTFALDAEELPDNAWATKSPSEGGMGFSAQWNDKFKNVFEEEFAHYRPYHKQVNLSPLMGAMYGYSNHVDYGKEYNFGSPLSTVNYLGSHDFIGNKNPILRIVSDYNFYEKVDSNYFTRVKPLEDPVYERFALVHNDFTHGVGRTAYGILFTKPGSILFFQGEELGNDINIENEWSYINAQQNNTIPSQNVDIHRFVGSHRVPWEYLDSYNSPALNFVTDHEKALFAGTHKFFKDMIAFRRAHPKLNLQNAYDVQVNGNIITYVVDAGVKRFFIVANFGEDKNGEWVSFPRGGDSWWVERFNSSEAQYSNKSSVFRNVISNIGGRANHLRLMANSIYVFERTSRGELSIPLYLRGSMSDWLAHDSLVLRRSSDQGDLYSTVIDVPADGEYNFKVASKDWSVEFGAPERGANVEQFGQDLMGQLSNMAAMPNISVKLSKGRYRFMFNIIDYKFSFLYMDNKGE